MMQFLRAVFLVVTFSCQTFGQCVFPCSYQNRTYRYVETGTNTTYEQAVFSPPGNLTKVISFVNGNGPLYIECVHRSGPFSALRYYNGTHWLYRCNKDMFYGTVRDVIVILTTDWEPFIFYPTLCDVCNGFGFKKDISLVGVDVEKDVEKDCAVVEMPELECNMPGICPVTQPGQIQCPNCPYDGDGLCC